jgi:hypothetical protein
MDEVRKPAPGDAILDRYLPELTAQAREEARVLLFQFVAWQVRIIARQVRKEHADSHDSDAGDTLESNMPRP